MLTVDSCEDPLQLVFQVVSDNYNGSLAFNVREEKQGGCEVDVPVGRTYLHSFIVYYSRNASYLNFQVRHVANSGECGVENSTKHILHQELY